MSRGFSLRVCRTKSMGSTSTYAVFASGWDQPHPDRQVGEIAIDYVRKSCDFVPMNDWEGERFFFPELDEILRAGDDVEHQGPLNQTYGWWNMRLIHAIYRILNNEKYKEEVWFYQ